MTLETGVLFAFGAMVCWGAGDFLIQRSVWKVGDVEALAFIGIIGSLGLLPFVINDIPLAFMEGNLLLLFFLGLLTFIVALMDFEALKKGKLSVIEVILEVELPVTAILGVYLLKETLTLPQILAMAAVFVGITLIATKSVSIKSGLKNLEKGVLIGLLGAIGMGAVNFLTGLSSKTISPMLAIWAPWVFFTIFCVAYILYTGTAKDLLENAKKYRSLVLLMGVFDTLAWLFYAFATQHNSVAITTAITESYPVIAIGLGVWLNKEKILSHQYAGAFLALGASISLALI